VAIVPVGMVVIVRVSGLYVQQVDETEPHAPLCADTISKGANGLGRAPKHDTFQAMIMVQANEAGCGNQVVMFVLKVGKPLRQIAEPAIDNIG